MLRGQHQNPSEMINQDVHGERLPGTGDSIRYHARGTVDWVADRIGSTEAGKFGYFIAVQGDPITDITELERISLQ
jgi:hypothetical protein